MRVLGDRGDARMRLVIVESPYAGEVEANVAYARAALRDSLDRGEAPAASHLLYTQPGVLDDLVPGERALGIAAGLAWRRVADGAAFYVDRGWSPGMLAARDAYDAEGRPWEERRLPGWADPAPGADAVRLPLPWLSERANGRLLGALTLTAVVSAMWLDGNRAVTVPLGWLGLR